MREVQTAWECRTRGIVGGDEAEDREKSPLRCERRQCRLREGNHQLKARKQVPMEPQSPHYRLF